MVRVEMFIRSWILSFDVCRCKLVGIRSSMMSPSLILICLGRLIFKGKALEKHPSVLPS